jgi:hypothetical protein
MIIQEHRRYKSDNGDIWHYMMYRHETNSPLEIAEFGGEVQPTSLEGAVRTLSADEFSNFITEKLGSGWKSLGNVSVAPNPDDLSEAPTGTLPDPLEDDDVEA